MQSSELSRSRKALAALVGFLARERASCPASDVEAPSGQVQLIRDDGASRKADVTLFKLALQRGLILAERKPGNVLSCTVTPQGRSALKRWLADPDSAFQDQHRTLATRSDPDHGLVQVNQAESPLTALARIKGRSGALFLEPGHVEAGERLRIDFTRGQMQPSLGQRWEPVGSARQSGSAGGEADLTEAAMSARLRVDRALQEVGPELSGVLLDVCCFLKGLAEVERERQWPARSAKLMLRTALAALARHYAMPKRSSRQPAPPPHAP
ncbi:DUF6456 domain-containing protein [uncultured Hoeflea sp.]|uniref:DUF6456 domain-containing protein n=1 Tax=uncultured Hoeflea sp. TaxID=538666 RepID=UPI0030D8208F